MGALAKICAARRAEFAKKTTNQQTIEGLLCGTSVAARIRISSRYTFDVGQESICCVYDDEVAYSWRKASLRVSHAPCSVEVVRRKQEKTQ